jgi:hypothetical protein
LPVKQIFTWPVGPEEFHLSHTRRSQICPSRLFPPRKQNWKIEKSMFRLWIGKIANNGRMVCTMHIAEAGLMENKQVKTTTPFCCRQNLAPHTLYLPSANTAIPAAFLSSLLAFLLCVVEGKGFSDIS